MSLASFSAPHKDVQIDTPTSLALEDSSYELTCSVSGSFDHIYWMKNWEKLHPDNGTFFSMDNKTVTFMPVDRYDTGKYKCMAINAIGSVTSAAYMLHVNCKCNIYIIHLTINHFYSVLHNLKLNSTETICLQALLKNINIAFFPHCLTSCQVNMCFFGQLALQKNLFSEFQKSKR